MNDTPTKIMRIDLEHRITHAQEVAQWFTGRLADVERADEHDDHDVVLVFKDGSRLSLSAEQSANFDGIELRGVIM